MWFPGKALIVDFDVKLLMFKERKKHQRFSEN